jgi:hypothetical protein
MKTATYDKSTTKGHTCFFYTDANDRFKVLSQYFKQGLDNNELCIFATAESQDDTIQYFMNAGLDVSKHVQDRSLRVFEMNSTYITNGKFVADYMLSNVSNFIDNAKEEGYSGLRTAGEMNWTKDHPESDDAVIDYEEKINVLSAENPNFIGLCLYAIQKDYNKKIIRGAASIHPTFIYSGQIKSNPYFTTI